MRRRLALIVISLVVSTAQAGLVIESVTRDTGSGRTLGTQRLVAQGGAARMGHSGGESDSSYVIVRDEVLYVVEPAQRRVPLPHRCRHATSVAAKRRLAAAAGSGSSAAPAWSNRSSASYHSARCPARKTC